MKKSIIKEIFSGRIGGREEIEMTEEEIEHSSVISDAYDALLNELSPNQLKLHEAFTDAQDNAFYLEGNNLYVAGFKIGLLIGIECMED